MNYTMKVILFRIAKCAAMGAAAGLAGSAVSAFAPKPPTPIQTVAPTPEPTTYGTDGAPIDTTFTEINSGS